MIARDDEAKATNVYWSPFSRLSVRFQMPLLLADECPQFVHFQSAYPKPNHDPVVQLGTAAPHAGTKAHDRVPVNARQPLDCPDAHSFGQAANHLNLLVPRKRAHDACLPYVGEPYQL